MVLFLRSHRLIPAEDVKPIPTETVEEEIQKAMRAKLTISQDILNGLVTRDFELIQQAAGELKKVSLNAPEHIEGDETDNELYKHFRLEFLRINTLMEDMAKDENVEGAAFAYQSLTANCLACHSYLHANDDDGPIQLRRE
ncbi:MAG: hypothetical protein KDA80_06380 [Planctomycetaceae bacterium]|nr:hypothetical protein [Planctomycetaceae bacterium]